jgi:hypothetical protein
LPPVLIFVFLSPTSEAASHTSLSDLTNKWHYYQKVFLVFDLIDNYHLTLDLATAAILSALAVSGLTLRRIVVSRDMWLPIAMLIVAFVLMPGTVFSSWAADYKFPIALALTLIAATDWRMSSKAWARMFAMIVGLLFVARVSVITGTWQTYDQTYDKYRAALSSVSRGARVTGAVAYRGPARVMQRPPLNHLLAFVTIERDGFFPSFFGFKSQQPVIIKPSYDVLATRLADVSFRNEQLESTYLLTQRNPFSREILRNFDYLLIVREAWFGVPIPEFLKPVFSGTDFRLYRIALPNETGRGARIHQETGR